MKEIKRLIFPGLCSRLPSSIEIARNRLREIEKERKEGKEGGREGRREGGKEGGRKEGRKTQGPKI